MAKLTLGGATFDVRPLTLFDLKAVGPAIDRINISGTKARASGEARTIGETLEIAGDLLEVMAAGIDGEDGESLAKKADAGDLKGLWPTYEEVVKEAGFGRQAGEARPAAAPAKPSRSRSGSKT